MKTNVAIIIMCIAIFSFCGCTKDDETIVEERFYTETSPPEETPEEALPVMEDTIPDKVRPEYQSIKRPVKRTVKEVNKMLKKLGRNDDIIKDIYDNRSYFPDNMLEALANNPEMADFVYGYLHRNATVNNISLTKEEKRKKYPLFIQWDPRWGYEPYGDNSNIGLAGCGPTCVSMILYYLTGNENLTPDKIAEYSMSNGYYMEGTGTAWTLMEDVPAMYDIRVTKPQLSEDILKLKLDRGSIIICAMRAGDFTVSGHFIVIYGYDRDGFMINDPNCIARSKKRWTFKELEYQIKSIWAYERSR